MQDREIRLSGILRHKITFHDGRAWPSLSAFAIVFFYIASIPFAAANGGDFIHLWVGARAFVTNNPELLYDPVLHRSILNAYQFPLDTYWGPRYDILGAFFYPPVTGLLYSPLGYLDPVIAQGVQAFINIGFGILSAWLLSDLIERRISFPMVILLLFLFPPFFFCFALGQNGIQTMGLVLLGLHALKKTRPLLAGFWWSCLLYKPNWLVAIGWLPVVLRNYRIVLGLLLGASALTLIALIVFGPSPFVSYFAVFTELLRLQELPAYPLETQYSLLSLIRRLNGINSLSDIVGWLTVLLIFCSTLRLMWLGQGVSRQHEPRNEGLIVFALAIVTAVAINPHLHHYDLLLVGAMGVVALSEMASMEGREKQVLVAVFSFQYLAFLLEALFSASYASPTLSMLSLLFWLKYRTWTVTRKSWLMESS